MLYFFAFFFLFLSVVGLLFSSRDNSSSSFITALLFILIALTCFLGGNAEQECTDAEYKEIADLYESANDKTREKIKSALADDILKKYEYKDIVNAKPEDSKQLLLSRVKGEK